MESGVAGCDVDGLSELSSWSGSVGMASVGGTISSVMESTGLLFHDPVERRRDARGVIP